MEETKLEEQPKGKYLVWIEETKTYHKALDRKAVKEIATYGGVVLYRDTKKPVRERFESERIWKEINERVGLRKG